MTRLKCPKCGNVFEKKVLASSGAVGVSGFGFGAMALPLVWPFVLRVHAECPVCKQEVWLKVVKPWSKG